MQALHMRFGSTAYDYPMEVLKRLRQTTIVAVYKAEFEAVSNRIKGLSPLHKLSYFLSGLKDEIHLPVRMLNPQSLNAAFGLAKIQEEYVMSCKRSVKYQQDLGKNSILGLPKSNGSNGMVETKPSIPIKRITLAQMDERRKKGLCYNCDEKWGPGHKCGNAKLFLLEGIELVYGENSGVKITELDEEVDSEVGNKFCRNVQSNPSEEVEITLYALTGTPTPGTIRVMGRINGCGLVILIDTSSTHNFVDSSLVNCLQLRVDVSKMLEVKVANGSIVKTQGFCSNVAMFV